MQTPELREKPLFSYISHWFTCVARDSIQQSKKIEFYRQILFDFVPSKWHVDWMGYRAFQKQNKIWKRYYKYVYFKGSEANDLPKEKYFDDRHDHQQ